jgi:hypothetical protein
MPAFQEPSAQDDIQEYIPHEEEQEPNYEIDNAVAATELNHSERNNELNAELPKPSDSLQDHHQIGHQNEPPRSEDHHESHHNSTAEPVRTPMPRKHIDESHGKQELESNATMKRPVTSRSLNFNTSDKSRRSYSSLSHLTLANSYHSSINDFKYIGQQFVVGKPDPKKVAPHESKFQKKWQNYLKKLNSSSDVNQTMTFSSSTIKPSPGIVRDYILTKDERYLSNKFHTNDFKHTGDQFKVGKVDPKIKSPIESKFQKLFKSKLERLAPRWDEIRAVRPLSHQDLRELHKSITEKTK